MLITAGPTWEYLDDVRFLANGSSGRMGYAIAEAAVAAGHSVDLVSGPTGLARPEDVTFHAVVSAQEMNAVVAGLASHADIVFGVAAVADHRPAKRVRGKPPKADLPTTLELVPNPDILASVGADKGDKILVGFALESDKDALDRSREKLEKKNLDLIVINHSSAMGSAKNEVVLMHADGQQEYVARQSKIDLAKLLVQMATDIHAGKEGAAG